MSIRKSRQEIHDYYIGILRGWTTQIKQLNKAIRRKNKLINRLRKPSSAPAGYVAVRDEHPPRHSKYIVKRDGYLFTATPCYGMHEPWWVVKTMDGEADPVNMLDSDEWKAS